MNRLLRFLSVSSLLAATTAAPADDAVPSVEPGRVRAAVQRGLAVVENSARNYPEHRSCFSCHHQTLPMLATAVSREKGVEIDQKLLRSQARFTHDSFQGRVENLRQGKNIGGSSMTVGYGLWALEIAKWKKDETTTAMVTFLLENQKEDGSWRRNSNRPPMSESHFTCTILAVYYMRKFATEAQRPLVEAAAARAKEWILRTEPRSHEDLVSRLGALPLLGADMGEIERAREAVLDAQREDGGWGQLPGMKSDAYATGFTLFTLQRVRFPTSHPAYRRGVRFLLETQGADGSWFVKSRSKPVQVFFDNGDPHGKDQFISIPATCWATTALALALEPAPRRGRF